MAILYCFQCSKHKDESLFEANKSCTRLQCKSCVEKFEKKKKTLKNRHQRLNSKSTKKHYENDTVYLYFKKIEVIK